MIAAIQAGMIRLARSPAEPRLHRRTLMIVLAAIAALSACSTVSVPTGEGAGVSSSATATLTGLRATGGRGPLVPDAQLEQAALQQAGYMAQRERMSHTTGWGKDFASRMKDNGVRGAAAENIAEGRFDQKKLFDIWMNSQGHRRNILDPDFSRFGLAYVRDGKDPSLRYWALVLGR
jgi:uncharacterized protein YkwD